MAAVLLRQAVARLEKSAFSRLAKSSPAPVRLGQFVDGFSAYTDHGESQCLVAILAQGSAREIHGDSIARQFQDWSTALASVFEETGQKPRRAQRQAATLLAGLYGALLTAQLLGDPKHFRRGLKSIQHSLPPSGHFPRIANGGVSVTSRAASRPSSVIDPAHAPCARRWPRIYWLRQGSGRCESCP